MKIFPVGERVATVKFPLTSLAAGLRPKGLGGPWEHGEVGGRCPGDCSQIDHHRLGSGWHHSEPSDDECERLGHSMGGVVTLIGLKGPETA